jgi:hypothetical protein
VQLQLCRTAPNHIFTFTLYPKVTTLRTINPRNH